VYNNKEVEYTTICLSNFDTHFFKGTNESSFSINKFERLETVKLKHHFEGNYEVHENK